MLKIEVIKFEAQDVITTSVAEPGGDVQKGTCYCDDGCGYEYSGSYIAKVKHSSHAPCTKCEYTFYS